MEPREFFVIMAPVEPGAVLGILRWNQFQSVLFTTIGWIGVVAFVIALAFGFIRLVF